MLKLERHSQTNELRGRDTETGMAFNLIDYVEFGPVYDPHLAQERLRQIANAERRKFDDSVPPLHP